MKHENNRRYSHKLWLLGALMLPLAGCGSTGTSGLASLTTHFSVGVSVNDGTSQITVTKEIVTPAVPGTPGTPAIPPSADNPKGTPAVPGTPGTPAVVKWSPGEGGVAKFVFTSRPGSDAGYITSYRLTSDIINGQETVDQDAPSAPSVQKMNLYIPSGYTCALVSATQACNVADAGTVPANGLASGEFSLDLSTGLASRVIATDGSVSRLTGIEFSGVTSRGENFAIKTQVNSIAIKVEK